MNTTDRRILTARNIAEVPEPPDGERAAAGASYYWDRRAQGFSHGVAVRAAARDMGAVLASLASLERRP